MSHLSGLFLLFACLSTTVWGQANFSSSLDSLIAKWLPAGSDVGISVYDLTKQQSIYTYRDRQLSRPASTLKLLTTITALSRPDAEKPFCTEVWYKGVIAHDTLQGDLYVIGGFDPEFDEKEMTALVKDVSALRFSVIKGRVYGDVSMKDSLYFGNGWMWDDMPFAYQPYLSPLMFAKGSITVIATPATKRGEAAHLHLKPVSSYYTVTNKTQTRTPAAGKFFLTREWLKEKNRIIVGGNVEHRNREQVNVHSSQNFFLHTFLEQLRSEGIEVTDGYAFADFQKDSASVFLTRWETPMQTVVQEMLKKSDNLNAEAVLYRIGAQASGKKRVSATEGITEIQKLASQLGHNPDEYNLADGCGLSNYDYLSPAMLVDFLKYAYSRTDIFRKLYKALPIAGVDGTLRNRMKGTKAYKKVYAKTGSYTAINALAGYLKAANGHDVAFAILHQNVLSEEKARELQDNVCKWLCQ
ncbi:MAG: D-alanyl-D-alanine carboxypeptidase/D-alanyl-D-alanine-endopeptidase [Bacteroides sp.]